MSDLAQQVVALTLVVIVSGTIVWRRWRHRRADGCGGGSSSAVRGDPADRVTLRPPSGPTQRSQH